MSWYDVEMLSANPLTLGAAAKTSAQLIVLCKTCQHQNTADPADAADAYGAELAIVEWRKRSCACNAAVGMSRWFSWADAASDTKARVHSDGGICSAPWYSRTDPGNRVRR